MWQGHCICHLISRRDNTTRLSLILHEREISKTTNTGHLALRALSDARRFVWGLPDSSEDFSPESVIGPGRHGIVLALDGEPLTAEVAATLPRPLTLVVTDGNWRQATKMVRRIPSISALPRYSLPPGPPTRYQIRHEPHEGGLATLEAIARCLAILEKDPTIQTDLERPFHAMVEATLKHRGLNP